MAVEYYSFENEKVSAKKIVKNIVFLNIFWKCAFLRLKETIEPSRPCPNTLEKHSRHTLTFPKRSRFKKGLSAKKLWVGTDIIGGDRHNRWGQTNTKLWVGTV